MSGVNQRTLFQTWGTSAPQKANQTNNVAKKTTAVGRRKPTPSATTGAAKKNQPRTTDTTLTTRSSLWSEIGPDPTAHCNAKYSAAYEDDDDDLMVVAVYEAEKSLSVDASFEQDTVATDTVDSESTTITQTPESGVCYEDFPGIDSSSVQVWIYPTNYQIREYQLKISEAALFQNTLVCLPTGLGKTFIASVVMYNFYRWYPAGKIVFMAPTKPLVAQQIEACYKVMGIPQTHMAEMTGGLHTHARTHAHTYLFFFPCSLVDVNLSPVLL